VKHYLLDGEWVYREENYRKAFELVDGYIEAFSDGLKLGRSVKAEEIDVKRVLLLGMGGSGIVCDVAAEILSSKGIAAQVSKEYTAPPGEWDLIIAISYSGNTSETLNSLLRFLDQDSRLVAVTSDGRLARLGERLGFKVIRVRGGIHPRYAFPDMLGAILGYLENLGLDLAEINLDEIREFQERLKRDKGVDENPAKEAAIRISKSHPIIYVYREVRLPGYRLKCELNENAKLLCHYAEIPEALHNDIEAIPRDGLIIVPRSFREPYEISKTIDALSRLLGEDRVLELRARSKSYFEEIIELFMLSDYISLYTSVLRGVNPLILHRIERLKDINAAYHDIKRRLDEKLG